MLSSGEKSTMLFLHGRVSPAGNRWLVYVAAIRTKTGFELRPLSIAFGSLSENSASPSSSSPIIIENHLDFPMLIHYGRFDPIDSSHFTFAVDYEGQSRSIDAWFARRRYSCTTTHFRLLRHVHIDMGRGMHFTRRLKIENPLHGLPSKESLGQPKAAPDSLSPDTDV